MNEKIKQKWVDALKSGQYKQICDVTLDREILEAAKKDNEPKKYKNMCVLGVLMDLYREKNSIPLAKWATELGENGGMSFPNRKVLKWAGLSPRKAEDLMSINDDKTHTFPEMADIIDKTL